MRQRLNYDWLQPSKEDVRPLSEEVRKNVYAILTLMNEPIDPTGIVKGRIRDAIRYSIRASNELKAHEKTVLDLLDPFVKSWIVQAMKALVQAYYKPTEILIGRHLKRHPRASMETVREAAYEGVYKAALYFDTSKGYLFTTYARPIIQQSINCAVGRSDLGFELPENILSELKIVKFARNLLRKNLNLEPSVSEITAAVRIIIETTQRVKSAWLSEGRKITGYHRRLRERTDSAIKEALRSECVSEIKSRAAELILEPEEKLKQDPLDAKKWSLRHVRALLELAEQQKNFTSLNQPLEGLNAPKNATLESNITYDEPSVEDDAMRNLDLSILERILNMPGLFSERELMILKLYYGLDDCEPETLADIGKRFGVTREAIRLNHLALLIKLRDLMSLGFEEEDDESNVLSFQPILRRRVSKSSRLPAMVA